jgi:ribosome recycling factor
MYKFSKRSLDNLATAEEKLQVLFNEVIKEIDCTVIYGHRTPEEQFELFKQGREKKDGWWVKVGKTVTNLDGNIKKSKHNYFPSKAVDVVPFPLDWNNIESFKNLAVIVKKKAKELNIDVEWGGDWEMKDYPHWQVK